MRSLYAFLTMVFLISSPAFAKKLLILGDSLTEGYGVARSAAFPALIELKMKADHKDGSVINAGVSGSTSASAVSRLKWQMKSKPDLVLLALGSNDGLRGLSTIELEKNLAAAIELAQKEKVPVVLIGMIMPPNYSKDYTEKFNSVYSKLAKKYKLKFISFLLEGVAGDSKLNQPDAIHPNEKGHQIIATHVYNEIKELL